MRQQTTPREPETGAETVPLRGPHPLPLFLALLARQLGGRPDLLRQAMAGLRRYQQAPPPAPRPPGAEVARLGGVRLVSFGGPPAAVPLVVVPSIINSPRVLDLAADRSLLRHLAAAGHRVLLVDWGAMGQGERQLGLSGLVAARLLPLLRPLARPRLQLAGYCLGGTLALAAAQLLGPAVERLALIAAPVRFAGYPADDRRRAALSWQWLRPLGEALGAIPASLLNPMFWALDEAAVARKFVALGGGRPDAAHLSWFAAVEDWAGSGAPLPLAAARQLFEDGFATDRIGSGGWRVAGTAIRPAGLSCPLFDCGASEDRIVPPAARIAGPRIRRHQVAGGHVGLMIGRRAPESLWQPLSNWLHER